MRTKDYLEEVGLDRDAYRELVGYPTRARAPPKQEIPTPADRTPDKRKTMQTKTGYIPPQIYSTSGPVILERHQFHNYFQELLQKSGQSRQAYMDEETLYCIYKHASEKGGIVEVSSIGAFDSIVRSSVLSMALTGNLPSLTASLIQRVRQLIFSIQFIKSNQENKVQHKIYELGLVNFVGKEELRQYAKDRVWGLNYFNYDLTLFQQGAQAIQISKQIFNLEHMCQYYKKERIDIRIQNPLDYGFKPSKLKNKKYEMTLGEYRFYQVNYLDSAKMKNFKHAEQLGKGQIFFGVNFEPSDQMLNNQIKKNVSGTFLDFHGDFDLMSYLDTDIPGCSLPQMYFKTPGCWTGGHQENLNMSALNINHGPDHSQWFTLDLKYIDKLRQELLDLFNTDLYLSQGLWYQRLDWFILRGYPVKRFLQRKDDIVVTGPGTLHWVRSFGVAVQTSWNIFPKNYEQFQAAFIRHKTNKDINFFKSDIIPLKSLVLKYVNHERTTMPQKTRGLCVKQLEYWLKIQTDIYDQYTAAIGKRLPFYLKDLESFCSLCKQQVLVYFVPAPAHFQKGISCLECFKKNNKGKIVKIDELFFKHDIALVQQLIEVAKHNQLNKAYPQQIKQLCKGVHVGEIQGVCLVKGQMQGFVQPTTYQNQEEIDKKNREIFYGNQCLFELYTEYFDKLKVVTDKVEKAKTSQRFNLQARKRPSKMMAMLEQGQMMPQPSSYEVVRLQVQCQTDPVQFMPEMQPGQISKQEKSRSRDKKKKHKQKKSKSKNKKSRSNSPQFSQGSQQKREVKRENSSKSSRSNKNNRSGSKNMPSNRYDSRERDFQNDNNFGSRSSFNDRSNNRYDSSNNRDNYGGDNYNSRGSNSYGNGNRDSFDRRDSGGRNNWRDNNNQGKGNNDQRRGGGGRGNWRDNNDQSRGGGRGYNNDNNYNNRGNGDQGNGGYGGGNRYNNNSYDNGENGSRRNFNNFNRDRDGSGGGFEGRGRGRGRGRGGFNRNQDGIRDNNNQGNNGNNYGSGDNNPAPAQNQDAPEEY